MSETLSLPAITQDANPDIEAGKELMLNNFNAMADRRGLVVLPETIRFEETTPSTNEGVWRYFTVSVEAVSI